MMKPFDCNVCKTQVADRILLENHGCMKANIDPMKLTVPELKAELSKFGKPLSGNKKTLQTRLETALTFY